MSWLVATQLTAGLCFVVQGARLRNRRQRWGLRYMRQFLSVDRIGQGFCLTSIMSIMSSCTSKRTLGLRVFQWNSSAVGEAVFYGTEMAESLRTLLWPLAGVITQKPLLWLSVVEQSAVGPV